MSFSFTLTTPIGATRAPQSSVDELAGEDISLLGGDFSVSAAGDLTAVAGALAARQSVERELPANPGSFARRQNWGGGLSGMIFKGNTPAVRDRATSRAQSRLQANPRIAKILEVSAQVNDGGNLVLVVRADAVGGRVETDVLIRPPGVT